MTPPSSDRWKTDHLVSWCGQNKLELNALKTVEMAADLRENPAPPAPSPCMTPQSTLWSPSTHHQPGPQVGAKHQQPHQEASAEDVLLRQLKKLNLQKPMMVNFYTTITESILTSSITIWYTVATAKDKGRLQCIIRCAEKVIGCNLSSLQDQHTSRTLRQTGKFKADPSHPGHKLFWTLPSSKRLQSILTKSSHHKNSFFPTAVGLIVKAQDPHWYGLYFSHVHYILT